MPPDKSGGDPLNDMSFTGGSVSKTLDTRHSPGSAPWNQRDSASEPGLHATRRPPKGWSGGDIPLASGAGGASSRSTVPPDCPRAAPTGHRGVRGRRSAPVTSSELRCEREDARVDADATGPALRKDPWMSDTPDARSLLGELTLEEKASLCLGSDFWRTTPVPRLGIAAIMVSDGPHGLRRQPDDGDHVGISGSVPATCFPTAAALGSSWDPGLLRRVGQAIGRECRDQGVSVLLGPGINIKRSPLCGATSSTSPRTRCSRGCWGRRWSKACSPRAWAPARSTTPRTIRRPTGSGSPPMSTSAPCVRSTSPASSGWSLRLTRGP